MELKSRVVANKRLLVANRGEIATRIFRAATELNMQTIAIYSHEDRFSVHRFKADEAYKVGQKGAPLEAYLNWQEIVELAVDKKIDAIHPGYGFLSENDEFAKACEDNDILFCGPNSTILKAFGDKLTAKKVALDAGLPVIPGTQNPVETLEEAKIKAQEIGYPITLKALSGGGGKGIRIVKDEPELIEAFNRARSEAMSSFGKADVYLEKNIQNPKHIEVQIAGDCHGQVIHLFERDCSIQRRHQKVVELAPAIGISTETRSQVLKYAVDVAKSVDYVGIGTVEFLVDQDGKPYFLEVNPRIQVEHTVTEMITGVDLVQMSILMAAGRKMNHPAIGIDGQESIKARGVAIQCRITTENPQNDFAPDTGVILAYRPAQGFGIRLDEGLGTSGGLVTPYYDSLLVKVTAHSFDLYGAARKMSRALKEFRIRGVKHNIPLLINILEHPNFLESSIDTSFLSSHPELFQFKQPRDRATRLLKFIANTTVNNPHNLSSKNRIAVGESYSLPKTSEFEKDSAVTAKKILEQAGPSGLQSWVKEQKSLLLTDTTMRDAHQSLFATRLRNYDILQASDYYRTHADQFFSLEVWGGATFDTCMRFLKEDPWERLAILREKIPNIMLQMLFRGSNAVGYTNYPEWVVRDFVRLTCEAGLDVFRIFDCLNNATQMVTAIEEVKKHGKVAEACVCYTGNILDPSKTKYTLDYFVKVAKELETMGADILCIKDMAGLLRPKAAEVLIKELKNSIDLPIHLHTHASSGSSEAMLLAAAGAGCDIVDGAVSSMSGLTSQPSLNATISSLEGQDNCPTVPLKVLDELSRYWGSVREKYHAFDPGLKATSTDVYEHEIPGGQYSNLVDQARRVGVSPNEFYQLTLRYKEVNQLLGDIVKVTPSSKVVGDMALLLQKHGLTGETFLKEKPKLDYPDSAISFFKGHMGVPYGGFNEEVRAMVLGDNPPPPCAPPVANDDSLEKARQELESKFKRSMSDRDVLSYRLYPKVWQDFMQHKEQYGRVEKVPTDLFFYGLEPNREVEIELEMGKTLYVSLSGMTEPNEQGIRRLFFQLNGFPRALEIEDESANQGSTKREKADSFNTGHVPSPMPGKILEVNIVPGDTVKKGQALIVMEAMKMEYIITAKVDGKAERILVNKGDQVEEADLLVEIIDA
ncbi:pyruvate carboxylase [Pseudobacteriovorax antillogorgiicola]|uniref:Pyruvate carboxylase n=1 Tax=Pseudobacteriovorax antillogorgiicola TaxID=1513793 RepID=A0A1Y6B9T0_9BACT|nr:pyruvate carboxylase [Pseudobacteriovorax antillogorgiicola]TCS59354.1 pyruvate carboxylase [Pseudobacteriovorax antillogorgiicola]SME89085.1 pyruvate carboxylase [Pseudobacteriovorax antillogorgiicola]